jgi:hypothetical protein
MLRKFDYSELNNVKPPMVKIQKNYFILPSTPIDAIDVNTVLSLG